MVGILTFSNSLINEFVWDDRAAVIGNPDVVDSSIWQLLEHDFWGQPINSSNSHKSYRPITVLSFKLNYMLFGLSPMAFHAMNVALHGWVCYLVCECGQSILGSKKGSIIAGLLFAVHPIHCDAVSSIVGRADVLCTMFSLMSFLCYQKAISITARNKRLIFIGLSMMLLLAGMHYYLYVHCDRLFVGALSKELGISMIGIFLVVEWQRRFVYKEANERRCGMLLIFVACFMKWRLQLHGESMLYQWTELENYVALLPNVLERILTTAHCHAIYLWKLIWPKKLSYDYGFNAIPKIDSLLDSRCISTLVAYALVAGGLFQIRQNSTLILIAAFCLLPFVPAANVLFPVGAVVAERVLYFPSVGFCLGMAYLLEKYVRISVKGLKVVGFCITAILSLKCILRNTEWKTEQSLFESGIRDYPSSVKMLSNRATQLLNPKDANIAKTLLESAIFIYPQYESAHLNLGLAFDFSKNSLHAIQEYHIVLEINQARFIVRVFHSP